MQKKIIYSGKIFENKLIDYPQYLIFNENSFYELVISNKSLILKIDLYDDLTITIPFKNSSKEYYVDISWRRWVTDRKNR